MAQAVHTITPPELLELLVKKLELHEGIWQLHAEWNFQTGIFGPNPAQIFPGALVMLARVGLQKADRLNPLAVDAAKVNPKEEVSSETTPSDDVPPPSLRTRRQINP